MSSSRPPSLQDVARSELLRVAREIRAAYAEDPIVECFAVAVAEYFAGEVQS